MNFDMCINPGNSHHDEDTEHTHLQSCKEVTFEWRPEQSEAGAGKCVTENSMWTPRESEFVGVRWAAAVKDQQTTQRAAQGLGLREIPGQIPVTADVV